MSVLARLIGDGRAAARDDQRWVVVDTETAGLDPARDALLAIGAVAVDGTGVRLDDSFEVVVRNDPEGDRGSVLVHGIGHGAQLAGVPARDALQAFAAYVAGAPCVAFHAEFDRAVLRRACRAVRVAAPPARWLDAALLAEALHSGRARPTRGSLDDWLAAFDIAVTTRHNAAGDALATAELLLRLVMLAQRQGVRGFAALRAVSRQRKWLALRD